MPDGIIYNRNKSKNDQHKPINADSKQKKFHAGKRQRAY